LTTRSFFIGKEGLNPQLYYSSKQNGWFALLDSFQKKTITLDELYFHTKRQAFEVYYIPLDNNKPFVEAKKNQR